MFIKMVRLSSLLVTFVLVTFALCFEFPALAGSVSQNSNSSTTTVENTNTAAPSAKKGRRSRRPKAATTTTPATPAAAVDSAAMPEAQDPASQQAAAVPTEQTDLSGTYAGTFDCADAGLNGETTLTITGNQFTTADGKSGRITAATTQGYTGVALHLGESTPATGTTPATVPTIVSMRAKKAGSRLTLTSVPSSGKVCSFTPAGLSRVTRTRKAPRGTPAATPAQPAVPAAMGEPVTAPATPVKPVAPPPATEPMTPAPAAKPATPPPAAEPVTPGAEAGPAPPAPTTPSKRAKKKPGGITN